jgi:ParB-like chromosome segregation protein Spo0J
MTERLRVEYRKIETLIPFARNPRTHSEAQIAKLAASIVEFGWTQPILVDGANGIIAGHGRLAAARKLGLQEVPVIELGHLSPAQKRAYVIADNRLAQPGIHFHHLFGWYQQSANRSAGSGGG